MVYTHDAMTSPAPDAPLVPSTVGALAEAPSPRWRRAAQGLRWMRGAIYAGLVGYVLGPLALFGGEGAALGGYVVMSLSVGLYLVVDIASAVGLWRFGSVPASTGAARPARQSFLCFAAGHGWSLLCVLLFQWPATALHLGSLATGLFVLWPIALLALSSASLALLARALGAVFRSLGETPPAWLPMLVGAYLAPWILMAAIGIGCFVTDSHPISPMQMLLSALWLLDMVAIALALASAMGRAAGVLERQESPESVVG